MVAGPFGPPRKEARRISTDLRLGVPGPATSRYRERSHETPGIALRPLAAGGPSGARRGAPRPEAGAAVGGLDRTRARAGARGRAGRCGRASGAGMDRHAGAARARSARAGGARRGTRHDRAVPLARGRRRVPVPGSAVGRGARAPGDAATPGGERRRLHHPLALDIETYRVTASGCPLDLTYKEFELLRFLASNPGRVFTRPALLREVWGYDFYGGTRTVDVHVRRLRAKLGPEHEHLIETVRGVGYRSATPVS